MSQAQCDYCDAEYPKHDVYYACLFINSRGESQGIEILGPIPVKRNGAWLRSELLHSQYLPIAMRDGMDRYSSVFNGAALFKIYQVLLPNISSRGDLPGFDVKNLFVSAGQEDTAYKAFRLYNAPTLMHLVSISPAEKRLHYLRPIFVNCNGATSELELVSMPEEDDDDMGGLVELMDAEGHTLYAESPEVALFRKKMITGCRYVWFLNLIAENIDPMKKEFAITSGPMYELECREYREEHGCEPPADYAVRISTAAMRTFMQEKGDSYATVIGQVTAIEQTLVDCQPMTCITIKPMVDNDDVNLQVFVSREVMGKYTPTIGETVTTAGYVYAAADELLVDSPSWQDSPDVGEKLQEHDNDVASVQTYHYFSRYSMGHAVAASAFVKAGWEIAPCDMNEIYTRNKPLFATSQKGEITAICVDTIINGQENTLTYDEHLENLRQGAKNNFGEDVNCCHCIVRLDYRDKMERFSVKLEMEPEFPGVKNTLIFAANPNHDSVLSIEEGKEPQKKKTRPDTLDESMAAKLFMEAMAHGKWAALAEWISEDADFETETAAAGSHRGKLSILRYFGERIKMWQRNPDYQWKDFSFATGTVMYKGARRPCAALYYRGIPSAVTIFEDKQGLIGHIHNIPRKCFSTYKQEIPIVHQSIQPDVVSLVEESVQRPPHDAESLIVSEFSHHPELQAAAHRALSYLEARNCIPVYCNLSTGKVPHIWFRDEQERLCWAVLYTSDMRECEFEGTLTLGDAITLKKIKHYTGYIIPSIQNSEESAEQIDMIQVDWERWKNL